MTFSEYLATSFDQGLMAAIRRHGLVLLLGPMAVALLFYAVNPNLPGMYVSKAYLRLDGASAELLARERTNPLVADQLLGGLPETNEKTTTTRLYYLLTFMELVDAGLREIPPSSGNIASK
jgi:hypothetical protein